MNIWAILLAAGRGSRLAEHGAATPKQLLPLGGKPLLWRSAMTFSRLAFLRGIVFVVPARHVDEYSDLLRSLDGGGVLGLPWKTAPGGERRQDSVCNGLLALPQECDAVLVHDSARPFASAPLMLRVAEALKAGAHAVIPGIPVTDTIKSVSSEGVVVQTHERSALRAVQTPQGFSRAPLEAAHARARAEGWEVTDDAALMERCGAPVLVVPGEEANRKITTPEDLALLVPHTPAPVPCTGFGYDVHRYGGNRPFILGGVPIPCGVMVAAHSDGDTLLHALMDALLGCIGGGDIGGMFPDTAPAFEGISSGVLLSEVLARTRREGLALTHADITIVAQTPRIAPFREAIAKNLASLLGLDRSFVNVKATTEEGLGFTGEKKGVKVMVVVSGLRPVSGRASSATSAADSSAAAAVPVAAAAVAPAAPAGGPAPTRHPGE